MEVDYTYRIGFLDFCFVVNHFLLAEVQLARKRRDGAGERCQTEHGQDDIFLPAGPILEALG